MLVVEIVTAVEEGTNVVLGFELAPLVARTIEHGGNREGEVRDQ